MLLRKIDTNGLFIKDVIVDELPMVTEIVDDVEVQSPDPTYIKKAPKGFIKPKWNGDDWEEGADAKTVTAVQKQKAAQVTATTNKRTLEEQAMAAITSNKEFLAISSPTAAQQKAQLKKLTRQMNGLIRLVMNELDEVD